MFKKLFFIGFILFASVTLRAQEDIDAIRDSAFFYYSSKKFLKAGILFEKVALKSNDKNDFYNASCSYALANSKTKTLQLANVAFQKGIYGFSEDKDFINLLKEKAFLELIEKERTEIDFYNKKKREIKIIRPENFDPKTKYPLLIFIHGYGESPETYLDLIKSIDLLKKYIIIIPHGSEVVGRNSFSWSLMIEQKI
ncbi:alpha/beta hydrolase [Pontimicrobium aquaticum]|uniref:Esterase n=1 Tax=Pontimicrobium aquaticum TaxID=2565367 RepID=A0A4U0EYT4_9FLAO|nr:hypothetical protein [Pontimicrobium aquaticum]TJY37068.1 hypothetical protein E5167_03740 [Pontimicrobium aquaticum]